ncbi:MAG: TAXI family TRAP transporter solute-binding subunit [Sulfuritalea sp.]|nr:TAXI family TRAP transporter solute-binding subunit [Sulfuritalea sp.]
MRSVARAWIVIALLISTLAVAAEPQPVMKKFLALGTASTSGVYHPVGIALCDLVNKRRLKELIRCLAYSTGGSEYNIQAVLSGELSLGITRTDLAFDAYHGVGDFAERGPSKSLRQVFSLYDEPVTMIVKRSANIEKFEDIVGKRVNLGNKGSSQRGIVKMIMDAANLRNEDFGSYKELTTTGMGEAFCNDEIDVMFQALGMPAPFFKKMIEECGGAIFQIPPVIVDRILQKFPSLMRVSIPGGIYKGHPDAIPSFGMKTTLISSDKVDAESLRRFTAAVLGQLSELKKSHPALESLDAGMMAHDGILIPLHDGAAIAHGKVAKK